MNTISTANLLTIDSGNPHLVSFNVRLSERWTGRASDASLNESQRAALRFEAQRSRVSKSQRFNIDSETADDKEDLTHFGSSISEVLRRQQELDEREMRQHDSDDEDVMDAHMNFGRLGAALYRQSTESGADRRRGRRHSAWKR